MSPEIRERKRKHVFFLPLMFIGMGFGFLLAKFWETAFVGCMFIGMGLGFLLDSLFVVEEKKVKSQKPLKISSLFLMIFGIVLTLGGIIYLIKPSLIELIKNHLIALGFIAFGLLVFVKGVEVWKEK